MLSFFPSLIVVYSLHPDMQSVPEDGNRLERAA
jgi:hypothetical protein